MFNKNNVDPTRLLSFELFSNPNPTLIPTSQFPQHEFVVNMMMVGCVFEIKTTSLDLEVYLVLLHCFCDFFIWCHIPGKSFINNFMIKKVYTVVDLLFYKELNVCLQKESKVF